MPVTHHATCSYGLVPYLVTITASPPTGAGAIAITGLPDANARETAIRVVSALAHIGVRTSEPLPDVTVSGYVSGSTAHLDLPIAVAVLEALGVCSWPTSGGEDRRLYGELSLAGDIRPVRGLRVLLPRDGVTFRQDGFATNRYAVVPLENEAEAAELDGEHLVASTLRDVVDGALLPARSPRPKETPRPLLLVAKPGDGAMLFARNLQQALFFRPDPKLDDIYSVAGMLPAEGTVTRAPFRAPHHSVSAAGLVGSNGRPGEVSLAHRGILYLDDVHEFRRDALDALFAALATRYARHLAIFPGAPQGLQSLFSAEPAMVIATAPPSHAEELRRRYNFQVVTFSAGAPLWSERS